MTSRRFSKNKTKGIPYSFISAVKVAALPGGILAGLSILLFGVMPFSTFYNYVNSFDYDTGKKIIRSAKETYKFITFLDGEEVYYSYFFLAIIGILSLVAGILVFRFTSDKKTVNVYYSLGIKRTSLFYSRYLAGGFILCCAVAVGIIASYIVNLIFVGGSWQLSLVLLYFYCGLSLFALVVYTITAAVFASVGTVSEGVLYSAGIIALPTVICISAENLVSTLLKNTVYGLDVIPFSITGTASAEGTANMLTKYAAFNPVLFFSKALTNYSVGFIKNDKVVLGTDMQQWMFPNLPSVLPWFIIVVGVALLGGFVFFRLRKAENCGFLNTNKPLSAIVLFELMFFGATLFVPEIRYSEKAEVIAVCAIIAFIVYIAFEIFLERRFIQIIKKFWKLPVFGSVVAAVFVIFMTGGFGYADRVPEVADVQSVAIALPMVNNELSLASHNMSRSYDEIFQRFYLWDYSELPEIFDRDAIKAVVKVHRSALRNKNTDQKIAVRYTLKNKTTVERALQINEEELSELFMLYDTPEVKAVISEIFATTYPETVTNKELGDSRLSMFRYENSTVTAISKNMRDAKRINFSKEEFEELKKSVAADLAARTASRYYNAELPQVGVLRFSSNISNWANDYTSGVTMGGNAAVTEYFYEEDVTQVEGFFDDTSFEDAWDDEDKSSRLVDRSGAYVDYCYSLDYGEYPYYDVIIDSGMTNTLNFLKNKDAAACFDTVKKIKSVSFRKNEKGTDSEFMFRSDDNMMKEFFAYALTNDYYMYDEKTDVAAEYSENIITDNAKIQELDGLMRLHCYAFEGGYYCLVKFDDDTCTVRYMPENIAPQYVKDFNYQMHNNFY